MACCGGIDRLARGPRIGQQECPVHGQPLGRGDSKRIAMIETDIAVPVTDLVVTESDLTPILGARRYQDTGLRTGLAHFNLEVFNRDHGAVEQLLLPVCGADAQLVAARDLQRRGRPFVLRAPADDNRHPVRIGPFSIRQCGETPVPHQMRQCPAPRPACAPAPRWICRGSPVGSGPSRRPDRSTSFLHRTRYGTAHAGGALQWPMPHRRRAEPRQQRPATA